MKRVSLIMAVMLLVVLCAFTIFASDSRFVFSGKTIEDKRTGLVWTRNADLGRLDWIGISDLVKELNKKEYAGFKDWRVPNKDELDTLVTYAIRSDYFGGLDTPSPYQLFNQLGFIAAQPYWYWTSSPYENSTSYAWVISMNDGKARGENKDRNFNVWPVRGGKLSLQPLGVGGDPVGEGREKVNSASGCF